MVRFEGPFALATETYRFPIEPNESDPDERLGVATSVLRKTAGQWKIISMHNSARKPATKRRVKWAQDRRHTFRDFPSIVLATLAQAQRSINQLVDEVGGIEGKRMRRKILAR